MHYSLPIIQMLTAIIKLLEVAARSLFVLIAIYTLPIRSSGEFGLTLTLIGMFSFLCGFERYVDLQRSIIGVTSEEEDNQIYSVLRFFLANYILWIPLLAILLYYWISLPAETVLLLLIIAVSEHLTNEFYRIALITHKHRSVLFISMFKNIILLCLISYHLLKTPYDFNQLIAIWTSLSALGLVISLALFTKTSTPLAKLSCYEQISIPNQYKKSATHFKIGLVALLAVQADRLIAGGFLTIEDSGVYFRHIFIALSVYQVLGVISFNRVMPKVYASFRKKDTLTATSIILRERLNYFSLSIVMIILACIIKALPMGGYHMVQNVNLMYLTILLVSYLIRGIADFNVMSLNALYHEKYVFFAHLITVTTSAIISIVLTSTFGLIGLIITVLIAASIYLVTTQLFFSRIRRLTKV